MVVEMDSKYLDKNVCLSEAKTIFVKENLNMTIKEIAEELYAHAVLYYIATNSSKVKKIKKLKDYLIYHCENIDLEVGGDKTHRKLVYKMIWKTINL